MKQNGCGRACGVQGLATLVDDDPGPVYDQGDGNYGARVSAGGASCCDIIGLLQAAFQVRSLPCKRGTRGHDFQPMQELEQARAVSRSAARRGSWTSAQRSTWRGRAATSPPGINLGPPPAARGKLLPRGPRLGLEQSQYLFRGATAVCFRIPRQGSR